jgi:RNA polymerase sigma factor (sigma-70 family)
MQTSDWLAEQFEKNRGHLRAVAYRMMGSLQEADDAVQEAWLRLNRTGAESVENLGGWLTTVVGRVCLDMLRSRKAHREESLDQVEPATPIHAHNPDPEQEALMADSVGLALLVVLDRLTPAERLAFVLHDMFDLDFDEIGSIVGRSAVAARQLASRARRRVRGTETPSRADLGEQRRVVDSFLTALRAGDFNTLVALLDPELAVHLDENVLPAEAAGKIRGAEAWARQAIATAKGAKMARAALINGAVGLVIAPRGRLFRAIQFTIVEGKIAAIDMIGEPARLGELDLAILDE